jgi:hypothetical protein
MSRTTFALLAVSAVALSGCGGGSHFANARRPPTPVDLTVYVNNQSVSVSPGSVGAGPVIFLVTNQATKTVSLTIAQTGSGQALATTGPINPDGTGQVQVDFTPGEYTIGPSTAGENDAQLVQGNKIAPATLHIGRARPSADNALLQP